MHTRIKGLFGKSLLNRANAGYKRIACFSDSMSITNLLLGGLFVFLNFNWVTPIRVNLDCVYWQDLASSVRFDYNIGFNEGERRRTVIVGSEFVCNKGLNKYLFYSFTHRESFSYLYRNIGLEVDAYCFFLPLNCEVLSRVDGFLAELKQTKPELLIIYLMDGEEIDFDEFLEEFEGGLERSKKKFGLKKIFYIRCCLSSDKRLLNSKLFYRIDEKFFGDLISLIDREVFIKFTENLWLLDNSVDFGVKQVGFFSNLPSKFSEWVSDFENFLSFSGVVGKKIFDKRLFFGVLGEEVKVSESFARQWIVKNISFWSFSNFFQSCKYLLVGKIRLDFAVIFVPYKGFISSSLIEYINNFIILGLKAIIFYGVLVGDLKGSYGDDLTRKPFLECDERNLINLLAESNFGGSIIFVGAFEDLNNMGLLCLRKDEISKVSEFIFSFVTDYRGNFKFHGFLNNEFFVLPKKFLHISGRRTVIFGLINKGADLGLVKKSLYMVNRMGSVQLSCVTIDNYSVGFGDVVYKLGGYFAYVKIVVERTFKRDFLTNAIIVPHSFFDIIIRGSKFLSRVYILMPEEGGGRRYKFNYFKQQQFRFICDHFSCVAYLKLKLSPGDFPISGSVLIFEVDVASYKIVYKGMRFRICNLSSGEPVGIGIIF